MSDLGSELRRLLAEQGMSLRDLARHVPCDSGNLSKIARGQKRPSPELAARLDEVLGAGGGLAALAPAVAPGALGTNLDLIELARRAEASDLGSGTLGLLNAAVDGMCRDYPGADAAALSARAGSLSSRAATPRQSPCQKRGLSTRGLRAPGYSYRSRPREATRAWVTRGPVRRSRPAALAWTGRRGDLDEAISHGTAALRLPRRSAELLPRAGELCRAMADRYPR